MATKRTPQSKRHNQKTQGAVKVVRIRWNIEEQQQLINRAAELLLNKEVFSTREALMKAQSVLAKDRQREIAALAQVKWFTEAVPKRLKELEAEQTQSVTKVIEQTATEAAARAREEVIEEFIQQAGALLARVLEVAYRHMDVRPQVVPEQVRQHNPFMRHDGEKTNKPRVVVAGPLPNQSKVLEEALGNRLDLRFWTKDQSNDTLKAMLAHADHVVGMVGFLSHAHDNILKSSNVPYHPVSGGVSSVKQMLEKLL